MVAAVAGTAGAVAARAAVSKEEEKLRQMIEGEILDRAPAVKFDDIADLATAKQALQEAVILPRYGWDGGGRKGGGGGGAGGGGRKGGRRRDRGKKGVSPGLGGVGGKRRPGEDQGEPWGGGPREGVEEGSWRGAASRGGVRGWRD